jgi:hypothetical protein
MTIHPPNSLPALFEGLAARVLASLRDEQQTPAEARSVPTLLEYAVFYCAEYVHTATPADLERLREQLGNPPRLTPPHATTAIFGAVFRISLEQATEAGLLPTPEQADATQPPTEGGR